MSYSGTDQSADYAVAYEIAYDNGGTVDEESFKKYAKAGGAAGGAALCAAYGAAAVAPLCAKIGGDVAGWLAGKVPFASGGIFGPAEYWATRRVPELVAQSASVLAVQAYLFDRDRYIRRRAGDDAEEQASVDAELTKAGAPPAPIIPQWTPRRSVWETWLEVSAWLQSPPFLSYPRDLITSHTSLRSVTSAKTYAAAMDIPLAEALRLSWYGVATPDPPGSAVDFAQVAGHAAAAAQWQWWAETLGDAIPDLGSPTKWRWFLTRGQIAKRKREGRKTLSHAPVPNQTPAQIVAPFHEALGDYIEGRTLVDALPLMSARITKRSEGSAAAPVVVAGAGLALLALTKLRPR